MRPTLARKKYARSARACAAILTAWLGKAAHTHITRLRAIVDWSAWSTHIGIKEYEGNVQQMMWDLRRTANLHLVQKSYIKVEELRERLRVFNAGIAFTDRLGCLRGLP